MNLSKIKEHHSVFADGRGGLEGASEVHIGNVDRVEGGKYIKLTKINSPDRQHHWFPIDWIRDVNDAAVFLNKTVDEVTEGLMNEAPAGV